MIQIAIIEPCPVLGLGFQALFEKAASKFRVTGIYPDIPAFRKQCREDIDIILLNTSTFGYSCHFDIRKLFPNYADTMLIALTTEALRSDALASFDGALHLYDEGATIVRQLTTMYEDYIVANDDRGDSVSEREKEIIVAVAKGLTNMEIAERLHLSHHTVMSHRKRISFKLGIKGTAGFTAYAAANNLM
ncbi:MAG: LuxR C-terminal-related transcriptional regulator [Tannerellaceae bacterium]|jgi:DNA-binding NarL/FixJ family response regulator|nr:LuxR C-terminal-related transcriptional regulator [Tannerellaceae bacterium]